MDLERPSTSLLIVLGTAAVGAAVAFGAGASGLAVLGVPLIVLCVAIAFLLQWVAYLPAVLRQTEKFYDLVGSLTYLTVVAVALGVCASQGAATPRTLLVTMPVAVWAVRLGTFLFGRIHRAGKDARFEQIKRSWHRFLVAWTLQGLWVSLTCLAVLVMVAAPDPRPLGVWDALGLGVWALGFGVEVIADRQKAAFAQHPENRGRFITSGLWARSRHPNYAGEILLWLGLFVIGLPRYRGAEWLALLSPLFVWMLLRFVSGVPILEQRADERWGGQPDYEAYKARTPLLWPSPRRA